MFVMIKSDVNLDKKDTGLQKNDTTVLSKVQCEISVDFNFIRLSRECYT